MNVMNIKSFFLPHSLFPSLILGWFFRFEKIYLSYRNTLLRKWNENEKFKSIFLGNNEGNCVILILLSEKKAHSHHVAYNPACMHTKQKRGLLNGAFSTNHLTYKHVLSCWFCQHSCLLQLHNPKDQRLIITSGEKSSIFENKSI